jgi:hypothetical protein
MQVKLLMVVSGGAVYEGSCSLRPAALGRR